MKLIKPNQLGLLTRPYAMAGQNRLALAVIGFFELGKPCEHFLEEAQQWPRAMAALPKLKPLDEVFPKPFGELLFSGHAHAPNGVPVEKLDVRVRMGGVDKTVRIWGDRRWYYSPWYRITPPLSFRSMPLEASRAYGGPKHPENPDGCGYTGNPFAGWIGRNEGPMPNLEMPDAPVRGHVARGRPVVLGPLDPSRPARRRYAGTYGRRWQQNEAPSLPANLDLRFFQTAPADQWHQGPWRGDESYVLENLHPLSPVIEGKLPGFAARAFARTKADGKVHEIAMALDTVWFMPDIQLGVAIFHGALDIADCDALDIDAVLAAYERLGETRSFDHYEAELRQRTDPQVALYSALADQPLVPMEAEELRVARATARVARQKAALDKRQSILDELMAEHWQNSGQKPPAGFTPPKVEPSPLELDLDAVRSGDLDLGQWVGNAMKFAEQSADQAKKCLDDGKAMELAKDVDLEKEKQRIYERASVPAWDLLDACSVPNPDLSAALNQLDQAKTGMDGSMLEATREQLASLPAMKRQGRRMALKPAEKPLPTELARWLGEHIRQWRLGGVCLVGRDLAGADLRGIDLAGADLRETIFESCDLSGANFAGADLRGASFVGARLNGADFSGCRLDGANFSACLAHGARFVDASMTKAYAIEANFSACIFDGAVLDEMIGHKAILAKASLQGARLERALLIEAKAGESRWSGASLSSCLLLKADLQRADFCKAKLTRSVLLDACMNDGDWRWAHVEGSLAMGAKLHGVQADGLRSKGSGWRGSDWSRADMKNALCSDSDFGDTVFADALLTEALFARCVFQGAVLHRAHAEKADFWQALCRRADFHEADLRQANLRQALLDGACFDHADLRQAKLDPPQIRRLRRKAEEVRL